MIKSGAWDPYNVTEDADLGLRLWRCGYETGMITRPTLEDAPTNFKTWLPQRTRWFKGWMQTWVVHMRRPGELWRHMSSVSFLITQILLTGTIASALLHILFVVNAVAFTFAPLLAGQDPSPSPLAIYDWSIIAVSYLTFMGLCWQSTEPETRRSFGLRILLTPIYWLAISIAAWRGFGHLITKPFAWEKTPHWPHEKDNS